MAEKTMIMIKPDGVQRGLVGAIIQRFEQKGLRLVAMKLVMSPEQRFHEHYEDISTEPYFPRMVKYMSSGPVVPMVWEGVNAVKAGRLMIGGGCPTPGTIRGDFCQQTIRHGTVIHASDSVAAANREIDLWFDNHELVDQKTITESLRCFKL